MFESALVYSAGASVPVLCDRCWIVLTVSKSLIQDIIHAAGNAFDASYLLASYWLAIQRFPLFLHRQNRSPAACSSTLKLYYPWPWQEGSNQQ
jgi:hypothetical protein